MSYAYRLPVVIVLLLVGLGLFARTMYGRFLVLKAGKAETRWDLVKKRVETLLEVGIGQAKMFKEPASGLLHAATFWGFMVLGARTTQLFVQGFSPGWELPFIEPVYAPIKDVTALIVLLSIIGFFYRRLVTKPKRIAYSGEALLILGFIGGLMVTEFLFEGLHFGGMMASGDAKQIADATHEVSSAPIGSELARLFSKSGLDPVLMQQLGEINFWLHLTIVLTFLNLLPLSKHFHVITSLPNVFLSKLEPKGALSFVPDIEKSLEDEMPLGLSKTEDLSWKQILDLYTCTECGRCEVNCPAWTTNKPLNPKMIILDIRDHVYADQARIIAGGKSVATAQLAISGEVTAAEAEGALPALIAAVNTDAIWACTTCRSCSEQCPVMIEHVDKILDIRRHLVMTRNEYPKEVGATLKNLESKSNPWGMASGKRFDWAKDRGIPTLADTENPEYLFYVGCAGSFDDRAKEITLATAKILKAAGIRFAVMGKKEKCNGDVARRMGNEYLFQTMATENIETWKEAGVTKIVSNCPHCYNTIKNEYPQLGGKFEIVHHSQLIPQLVADGRIQLTQGDAQRIVFHDSCYMGRHNDVYDEPRTALRAIPGVELVEIERSEKMGMCCGAGGARMFMEEKIGERINNVRVDQLLEAKPEIIASSCPFCMTMLSDGLGAADKKDTVKTKDIAELIADRLVMPVEKAPEAAEEVAAAE
jgi:Fe-S oxidoreductase